MKNCFPILFLFFLSSCLDKQEGPEIFKPYKKIVHRIVLPEFFPDSTISELKIDTSNGKFSWKVANDKKERTYIIEEFRWNKYMKLGEVKGGANNYSFHVPVDSGIYHLIVKYEEKRQFHGNEIDVPVSNDVYCLEVDSRDLHFSKPTRYEIYDRYGKIIMKGFANKIESEHLAPDVYYLNYGNKTTEFIKKR